MNLAALELVTTLSSHEPPARDGQRYFFSILTAVADPRVEPATARLILDAASESAWLPGPQKRAVARMAAARDDRGLDSPDELAPESDSGASDDDLAGRSPRKKRHSLPGLNRIERAFALAPDA